MNFVWLALAIDEKNKNVVIVRGSTISKEDAINKAKKLIGELPINAFNILDDNLYTELRTWLIMQLLDDSLNDIGNIIINIAQETKKIIRRLKKDGKQTMEEEKGDQ